MSRFAATGGISDGKENVAPMWADVVGDIPSDTVIHTVALGPEGDPDEVPLSDIASDFNGDYYRVYTGAGAGATTSLATATANVLADTYRRVAESTLGLERIYEAAEATSCSGHFSRWLDLERPAAPGTKHEIFVESGLGEALFAVHFDRSPGRKRGMALYRPDGSRVQPGDSDVLDHRTFGLAEAGGHEQYRMRTPASGTWVVVVEVQSYACAEALVIAEAPSKNQLMLLSPAPRRGASRCDPIPVRAAFVGARRPVRRAVVEAYVVGAGEDARVRFALFDDGQHDDGARNDGLYGNIFSPCEGGGERFGFSPQR